ncbi:hypothetical protein [Aliarcobacter cryaerophilus]|nr:hypothetical protein [Aliarcobacter cryaerophilus]MCT7516667.1 hypothetical protein [Aliarcobacter cryaerophilus]
MKTAKILVQKTIIGLSEDNKAKLQSLEIYKEPTAQPPNLNNFGTVN